MKLWIVFVTFKVPGVAGLNYSVRYVDSQWASKDHARDRKNELDGSLKMGKVPEYVVELIEGKVADAAVVAESTSTGDDEGAQAGTRSQDS